jgi:hypothetical protein
VLLAFLHIAQVVRILQPLLRAPDLGISSACVQLTVSWQLTRHLLASCLADEYAMTCTSKTCSV